MFLIFRLVLMFFLCVGKAFLDVLSHVRSVVQIRDFNFAKFADYTGLVFGFICVLNQTSILSLPFSTIRYLLLVYKTSQLFV